ncbi:Clavaminate synthase-like protein [Mycena olivaceomarginata]|nr:Clavaminate synthase-like protein [Mycena olivaceomarginata]
MSNSYRNEDFPRCTRAGFQHIRSFLRDGDRNLVGFIFQEQQQQRDLPTMRYPTAWNVPLEKSYIDMTKKAIAAALLPTLREELKHIGLPAVVYRPRESEVRATCDTCLTSIFSCSWMCRKCGREACAECFDGVKGLTIEPDGASLRKIDELRAPREPYSDGFLDCSNGKHHGVSDFSPMTRFVKPDLAEAIRSMEQFVHDEPIDVPQPPDPADSKAGDPSSTRNPSGGHTLPDAAQSSDRGAASIWNGDAAQQPISPGLSKIPAHEIQRFADHELTEEVFRQLWAHGEPLLVTNVGHKLKVDWSPQYFIDKYGDYNCEIIECQTDATQQLSVGQFFTTFGQYDGRKRCWKLKDWPPSSDFKTTFPELYEDFSQAVPIPTYVRRDGALNLASHFPSNSVAPDLGPKMYNANANLKDTGGKGSTRLHMDMADALNLMTYVAHNPDGEEGCAAWDLFRAQDSNKLRQFLRAKHTIDVPDPIHSQQVYLDDSARQQLWEEYGVKSYRVYQRAGEAVFIPAGCAHQVRNLSDCIKVAIDFVSPENIARCEKLTREFREQNQSEVWKEDVLQLRTMMWFAWVSCCQQHKGVAS